MKIYTTFNIRSVPERKGVYAWYLKPQLSEFDIDNCIKQIKRLEKAHNGGSVLEKKKMKLVEGFLNKYVFYPLREAPYKVSIEGKLKPKYKGEVAYETPSSKGLISRLAKKPKLLFEIKEVFDSVQHNFLSPIYIGMAKNLNVRLRHHVRLMEQLSNSDRSFQHDDIFTKNICHIEEAELDHKFAHEVIVQRKLDRDNLEVHVMELEYENDIQVDIENIFNRLNYPLCGRN